MKTMHDVTSIALASSTEGGLGAKSTNWSDSLTPKQRMASKAALVALGVGAVGGLGYLVYRLATPKNVRVWPVIPRYPEQKGILSSFKSHRPPTKQEPEKGDRIHAGIDLIAKKGDKIVAISDGEVIGKVGGYSIGTGLQAVSIRHADADYIYGEIMVHDLKPGDKVKAGQVIGHVELNNEGRSMLHLEAWEHGTVPKMFTPWFQNKPMPKGLLNVQELVTSIPVA